MTGTIKKKTDRGFGFIAVAGEEKDLFFHSNSLVGVTFEEIQEGDEVTFDIEDSPKGKNAVNVKRADGSTKETPADEKEMPAEEEKAA